MPFASGTTIEISVAHSLHEGLHAFDSSVEED